MYVGTSNFLISLKTFVLILALIEFGLLATVIALAIIGRGKFGFASLHIVMYMILIAIIMIIGTSGNITKYSGGVEHLNIVEIKILVQTLIKKARESLKLRL